MSRAWLFALAVPASLLVIAASCDKKGDADAGRVDAAAPVTAATAPVDASPALDAARPAAGPCPEGMMYVDTMFCPKIERECTDVEHEKANHLEICHKFKEGVSKCLVPEEHRQFCIDKYEYPNQEGAHPVWMLDWRKAQATCESKGKRLCWASEWTAACEGPAHTPFPYGWARNHDTCNFDNFYIEVKKAPGIGFVMFSKNKDEADKELARLDQSVPSGFLKDCKSGFDVHDQTGNLDEWVISDKPPREKSQFAGLMGGAWGHVRNQCRPMTTSHMPHENYYFWSFRCCKDAADAPAWTPPPCKGDCPIPPPEVEPHDFAPDPIVVVNPAGPSKTKYGATNRKWFEASPDGGSP